MKNTYPDKFYKDLVKMIQKVGWENASNIFVDPEYIDKADGSHQYFISKNDDGKSEWQFAIHIGNITREFLSGPCIRRITMTAALRPLGWPKNTKKVDTSLFDTFDYEIKTGVKFNDVLEVKEV